MPRPRPASWPALTALLLLLCASAATSVRVPPPETPSAPGELAEASASGLASGAAAVRANNPAAPGRRLAGDIIPAEQLISDPVTSSVASIAAATCAQMGPERCRESQEFVAAMDAFCRQQYGSAVWDRSHYDPSTPRFRCDTLFFACWGLLNGEDAALTAQSCCAAQTDRCHPCLAGDCFWTGTDLLDWLGSPEGGATGYCDPVFAGGCCTC